MKRMRPMTLLAASLLAGLFIYSAVRLFRSKAAAVVAPGTEVIRLAHWQLEPGVREAVNAIAADYMKLHPHVRVEQMDIPGRTWKQWLRTRLIGGTAPDLIELASYENPDDMLARYFTPITAELDQPNPYNADEPDLRDVPWRRTYTAELVQADGVHYYNTNLLEYYGAPMTMVTVRVFYNRNLIKAALGEDRVPKTFDDFVALCEALRRYAERTGEGITPLAGSGFNITRVTDSLFSASTQKLAIELDYSRDLEMTVHEALMCYARGGWSLKTPAVRAGLHTVEAFGRYMPPGWAQLGREDSMLQFLQGRAAMIVTGTWDAGGILQQAKFRIGAFKLPEFSRDDPRFGRWTLGKTTEASTFAAMPFGLTRDSKHPERALDFLRYLTSRKANAKFAQISNWLPVIKGVPVPPEAESFRPQNDGYIGGINIRGYSTRAHELLMSHLHLLSGKQANVDAFVNETSARFSLAYRDEILRQTKMHLVTIREKDSVLVGVYEREKAGPLARTKFDRLVANQLEVEVKRLQGLQALENYQPAD